LILLGPSKARQRLLRATRHCSTYPLAPLTANLDVTGQRVFRLFRSARISSLSVQLAHLLPVSSAALLFRPADRFHVTSSFLLQTIKLRAPPHLHRILQTRPLPGGVVSHRVKATPTCDLPAWSNVLVLAAILDALSTSIILPTCTPYALQNNGLYIGFAA